MDLKKIIASLYIIYTVYIILIVNSTSLIFFDVFPAIVLIWLIFLMFYIGDYIAKRKKQDEINLSIKEDLFFKRKLHSFLISTAALIFSVLAANFYTGQTPISLINSLINGESVYYQYQLHSKVNNIGTFTITKIPYILMMFYIKLILFYSYIVYFIIKDKLFILDKICVIMITSAHVYFGLSRGTNFEFFELMILIIFVLLYKQKKQKNKKFSWKKILIIPSLSMFMLYMFYTRIVSRGSEFDFSGSRDFIYDPSGNLPRISETLSKLILIVYDYFGFGFFYVSEYISKVWFSSLENFIAGLIPQGYTMFQNLELKEIMIITIDIGTRWHPDSVLLINNYGMFGLLGICFLLGYLNKLSVNYKELSTFNYLTQLLILLQMISLPIGNFVFVSSATTLIVLLLVALWLWKIFVNKKVVLNNKKY